MGHMTNAARALLCTAAGYSLGSINPAYLIGMHRGYDIRKKGSGNPGATNTFLLEGKAAGACVMLFDVGKAALSVALCRKICPNFRSAGELAGTSAIFGHMFPAKLNFRGGKGLACIGGTILALGDFPVMLGFAVAVLIKTRYLCMVPISASVFYPLYHGLISGNWQGAAILAAVAPPVFAKHTENLKRIKDGRELRVDYIWNKEGEIKRTGLEEEAARLDRGEIPDKHELPPKE